MKKKLLLSMFVMSVVIVLAFPVFAGEQGENFTLAGAKGYFISSYGSGAGGSVAGISNYPVASKSKRSVICTLKCKKGKEAERKVEDDDSSTTAAYVGLQVNCPSSLYKATSGKTVHKASKGSSSTDATYTHK